MSRYFKTQRSTETGLKLCSLYEKAKQAETSLLEFRKKHGIDGVAGRLFSPFGDIQRVKFLDDTQIDLSAWEKSPYKGCYVPRPDTANGSLILDEIKAIKKFDRTELDLVIGFKSFMCNAGFIFTNGTYILFTAYESFDIDLPYDCIEISEADYRELSSDTTSK